MDATEHRAALVDQGERVVAVAGGDRLDSPVPSCPGWTVRDLIGHLGRVHQWAAGYLAAGPDSEGRIGGGEHPPEGDGVAAWYRSSLDALLAEIDRHQPDDPARTFDGVKTAGWWLRRQAQETAVHRWDAEDGAEAGGAAPIPAQLAVDGVDEWLDFFVPRFLARREEPMPPHLLGATVHMHATDDGIDGGEWLLTVTESGVVVERAHAKGDVAVRGPASDLLLVAWHRKPVTSVDTFGDVDRAEAVLDLIHVT